MNPPPQNSYIGRTVDRKLEVNTHWLNNSIPHHRHECFHFLLGEERREYMKAEDLDPQGQSEKPLCGGNDKVKL